MEDTGAAEWADYRLYLQPTRMLCGERIKPEKIGIYEDGSIRIDVGEEVAGSLCLTAEGSAGDTVEIFCGEELDESGQRPLRDALQLLLPRDLDALRRLLQSGTV